MELYSPLFCLTCDVDWASEACIEDFADACASLGIRPVLFATHDSAVLRRLEAEGRAQIGVHPHFGLGSNHGSTVGEVVQHVTRLFPSAKTFRSHSYVDGTVITEAFRRRGMRYDSNLCLYRQAGLMPLKHWSGMTRYPVFWEDDCHWEITGGAWDIDEAYPDFLTPGLKILCVHPANFALNIADTAGYEKVRKLIPTLEADDLPKHRHKGPGTRDFLIELLRRLREAQHRFWTLEEIHGMLSIPDATADAAGRSETASQDEYEAYWKKSPEARQAHLRSWYEKRNAADRYATSRDYNIRELEIEAINRHLPTGDIVDLGCGNGYTLISLAKARGDAAGMVGVDFSDNLIQGAKKIAAEEGVEPTFVCGDAIKYINSQKDSSIDGVITERFLLNLPNPETQHAVIADIARVLRPRGRFLMCEGSADGFDRLNALRRALGLEETPETSTDNVSSIRFRDAPVERFAGTVGLRMVDKLGFSAYFVISRALHPMLVAPQPPRFGAKINDLARRIQMNVPFEPGLGMNVVWVFEKL